MDDATRLIRPATAKSGHRRPVSPPIERATTILLPSADHLFDESRGVTYGISGLQAHDALAAALADLERADRVLLVPTGLAAMTVPIASALSAGDEVLLTDAVYGPTRRFCDRMLKRFGVTAAYYRADATVDEIMALANQRTRLIVLESPGSLTFEIQDVPAIAAAARARGIRTLIDNTYGAGLLFKPLEHGVDYSCQALSKYVGGHSDVFGGSIAVSDPKLAREVTATIDDMGWYVSPDDCWLMLRGLRTLPARMARHQASALRIAGWLADQPQVSRVLHPALPDFPGHELWKRDFTGSNGLFGVVVKGRAGVDDAFIDALQLFGIGVSWGGFESLAVHCRWQLSRRSDPPSYDGLLVRLHVGLEDPDDLIADLAQALGGLPH